MDKAHYTRSQLETMEVDDLDRMAFGVVGDELVELSPHRIAIKYHCDLDNPKHLFKIGGMEWAKSVDLSQPIDVSVDNDGKFHLEDGHHRWFAAGKTGGTLTARIQIKGRPIEKILADQERAASPQKCPNPTRR